MNEDQKQLARQLLTRAGLTHALVDLLDEKDLIEDALDATAQSDVAPCEDKNWFADYFSITGDHMVLTEEGWIPAEINTREYSGYDPMEVLGEVNAPAVTTKVSHSCT